MEDSHRESNSSRRPRKASNYSESASNSNSISASNGDRGSTEAMAGNNLARCTSNPGHYRLSLAYMDLMEPPLDVVRSYGSSIVELDMSYNKVSDLRFLTSLPNLQSLVLDHNSISSQVKIPPAPHLQTLWVNSNKIKNLGLFITTLVTSCPNLRIFSMMNNEAAPSFFNGGSYQQYLDYRYFVISSLPMLEVLDYSSITPSERSEAKRLYPIPIVQIDKPAKRKRKKKNKS